MRQKAIEVERGQSGVSIDKMEVSPSYSDTNSAKEIGDQKVYRRVLNYQSRYVDGDSSELTDKEL